MNIRIGCPGCQRAIECQAGQAGEVVACPGCGQRMRVPAAPPPPPPPPPPLPPSLREPILDDDVRDVSKRAPSRRGRPVLPAGAPADVLGETIAEFSTWGGWLLGFAGFFLLLGMVFGCAGAMGGRRLVGLAMTGLLFCLLSVIPAIYGFMRLGRRVIVCDNGLVDCWAGRVRYWTWDQVDHFYLSITAVFVNGVHNHTKHVYDVHTSTGEKLTYTEAFEGAEELGVLLAGEIARAKFTPTLEAMERGHWIDFGRFELGKAGLRAGRATLPWGEVEEFSVNKGVLRIFPRDGGAWESVPVTEVPNLQLLLRLGDHCKRAYA